MEPAEVRLAQGLLCPLGMSMNVSELMWPRLAGCTVWYLPTLPPGSL